MVKGVDDPNYLRFLYKYASLDPNYELKFEITEEVESDETHVVIFTEGTSDWKHIKAALSNFQERGQFKKLKIQLREKDDSIGDTKLLSMCDAYSKSPTVYPKPNIFLFDRDNQKILKQAKLEKNAFFDWGQNVFSMVLPVPKHRDKDQEISIEMLYKDKNLLQTDKHGKRLYLSKEFNRLTGRHFKEDLNFRYPDKLTDKEKIIDDGVSDGKNRNVALTKNGYANCVLNKEKGFEDVDFSGFEQLFNQILISQNKERRGSIFRRLFGKK